MKYEYKSLISHDGPRGSLVAIEKGVNCPFEVKRCFYICNTQDFATIRGSHANRFSKFLMIAVAGKCQVKVDTGTEKIEYMLDNPKQSLFLDVMVWKEMYNFSEDCVLLVLASEHYSESDYVHDYQEFLQEVQSR